MTAPRKPQKIGVSITFIGDTLQGRVEWDVRCPDCFLQLHLELLADVVNEKLAKVKKRDSEKEEKFVSRRETLKRYFGPYYGGRG